MRELSDSNIAAAIIGVFGALAGVVVGAVITLFQQKTERAEKRRSYISSIGMELDDQSTAILNICEYLRYLENGNSISSGDVFGLSRHLPGTPFVYRGQIHNLDLLHPEVSSYLVQYHSEIERAREASMRTIDEIGLTKSKTLSFEQFQLLSKKWRTSARLGSLVIGRLLEHHATAIDKNVRELLSTSTTLLKEAGAGKMNWEHPDA